MNERRRTNGFPPRVCGMNLLIYILTRALLRYKRLCNFNNDKIFTQFLMDPGKTRETKNVQNSDSFEITE